MVSYKGISGWKSGLTLPAADSWGANMNILRDPPKSIQTRQHRDPILMTSAITQMVQEAGDRVSEAILVYPRGVNPMVNVSLNNGSKNNSGTFGTSGKQAFLPYRVMRDGDFRPPIKSLRDNMPLSRLPRQFTSATTPSNFADFTKMLRCPVENEKGVKSETLKGDIRPTAVFKMETPIMENYKVLNVIKKELINYENISHIQPVRKEMGERGVVRTGISNDPLKYEMSASIGGFRTANGNIEKEVNSFIKEGIHGEGDTNPNSGIYYSPVDSSDWYENNTRENVIHGEGFTNTRNNIHVNNNGEYDGRYNRESMNVYYDTAKTGNNKVEYIHQNPELNRTLPIYEASVNASQNIGVEKQDFYMNPLTMNHPKVEYVEVGKREIRGENDFYDRTVRNRKTLKVEGMEEKPNFPLIRGDNSVIEFDQKKTDLRQKVFEMQMNR